MTTLPGTPYVVEVNPRIPERLARLEDLAGNLWYSFDRATRELFARLHPTLWNAIGHSPKAFLRRVDEARLRAAADDPVFLDNFSRILSAYDAYHSERAARGALTGLSADDLIAYFCAEFGFHESLPIYSGGLGILAGDCCKAASDMGIPFVGVGLLYRQGYFQQRIDAEGKQHVTYADSDFVELPVELVHADGGNELRVQVEFPGRSVSVRIWKARVGHVMLYLLDTDVPENSAADRAITYRLYGGDRRTRIEQEIVLGIGGVRALAALGRMPTVWHMNEGHAAFMVLERVRMLAAVGLEFTSALEAVAANTVFTTHTVVPAGHDHFAEDMVEAYFAGYCHDIGIERETLLALGRTPGDGEFNMTALALRGSRFHNGVSRINGELSAQMLKGFWPEVPPEENPIDHVTNGVHVPTFLASEWRDLFDRFLGADWRHRLYGDHAFDDVDNIPEHMFWSVHQYLKTRMLNTVRERIRDQHFRNRGSEAHLDRLLQYCDPGSPDVLTIGFGRRFATYKRATLIFNDLEWLRQIVGDSKRPVLLIFAGRAHPADTPGQELIRRITDIARSRDFEGRVLMVEGYDLRLARRLVCGVDVWLNTPVYPLEASGTSGMKAGINGVINLSVLDGWWGEGYCGDNGWAIKPTEDTTEPERRDREEARTLYEILQDQVVPLYYRRDGAGTSPQWIRMAKRSIATILPRFNADRMVGEYAAKFYQPAARQGRRYAERGHGCAHDIAAWKTKVRKAWSGVRMQRVDRPPTRLTFGSKIEVEVALALNGLAPDDVTVELLLSRSEYDAGLDERRRHLFTPRQKQGDEHRYALTLEPDLCGRLDYRIRAYPCHADLTHPLELGLMLWT